MKKNTHELSFDVISLIRYVIGVKHISNNGRPAADETIMIMSLHRYYYEYEHVDT